MDISKLSSPRQAIYHRVQLIRQLIAENEDISLTELSDKMGVTKSTVSLLRDATNLKPESQISKHVTILNELFDEMPLLKISDVPKYCELTAHQVSLALATGQVMKLSHAQLVEKTMIRYLNRHALACDYRFVRDSPQAQAIAREAKCSTQLVYLVGQASKHVTSRDTHPRHMLDSTRKIIETIKHDPYISNLQVADATGVNPAYVSVVRALHCGDAPSTQRNLYQKQADAYLQLVFEKPDITHSECKERLGEQFNMAPQYVRTSMLEYMTGVPIMTHMDRIEAAIRDKVIASGKTIELKSFLNEMSQYRKDYVMMCLFGRCEDLLERFTN